MPTTPTPAAIRFWSIWEAFLGRTFSTTGEDAAPPEWRTVFAELAREGVLTEVSPGTLARSRKPGETPATRRAYRLILGTLAQPGPPATVADWNRLATRYGVDTEALWDAAGDVAQAALIFTGGTSGIRVQRPRPPLTKPWTLEQLRLKPVAPKTTPKTPAPTTPTPPVIPPAKAMPTPPPVVPPTPPVSPREPVPLPAPESAPKPLPRAPEPLADGIEFADAGAAATAPEPPVEAGSRPAPESTGATAGTTGTAPATAANTAPGASAGATKATTETISNPVPETAGTTAGATESTPATASHPAPETTPVPLPEAMMTRRIRVFRHLLRRIRAADEPITASSVVAGPLSPKQRELFPEVLEAAVKAGAVRRVGRGKCLRYRMGDPMKIGFDPATLEPTEAALTA